MTPHSSDYTRGSLELRKGNSWEENLENASPCPCALEKGCRNGGCSPFIFTNKLTLGMDGTEFLTDFSHTLLSASLAARNSNKRNSFIFKCVHSEFTTLPSTEYPKSGMFFFSCLSVLLRPEFRTLFSPVAWAGFQTLCPILLNVSAALECVQVIPDKSLLLDSLKLNLTLNPGLHFVEDLSSKWDWVSRLGSRDLWGLEGVEVLAWSSASNSKVKLCWEEHRVVQGI